MTTHINKVVSLANLLKDMGRPVIDETIITKIVCSLPESYNHVVAAWINVPAAEQTVENLNICLL
jgi:hypothetical protein